MTTTMMSLRCRVPRVSAERARVEMRRDGTPLTDAVVTGKKKAKGGKGRKKKKRSLSMKK
jgi:hypothetical protein